MLLTGYIKEIFRPVCNPEFQSLHCIARLHDDVSEALPYLNAVLGGFSCCVNPPSVTFKVHGKLITVHADHIAVNALRDEEEADRILEWLRREINDAWEHRSEIEPSYESSPRPQVMSILRLLPRQAGCRQCGRPSCLVFAGQAAEGLVGPDDCPPLSGDKKSSLADYLSDFNLEA